MRESLDEDVSVVIYYDATKKQIIPYKINWHGREYLLGPVDFHHKTHSGRELIHHFSLADAEQTTYFKIALNTASLHWKLEEYMTADESAVHYGRSS